MMLTGGTIEALEISDDGTAVVGEGRFVVLSATGVIRKVRYDSKTSEFVAVVHNIFVNVAALLTQQKCCIVM